MKTEVTAIAQARRTAAHRRGPRGGIASCTHIIAISRDSGLFLLIRRGGGGGQALAHFEADDETPQKIRVGQSD